MTDELLNTNLGQYHLTELVRRGGMATVYKAHQPSLDRSVAVKVLFHNRDPQFAARFKREARAIAQLQHPNILPIYDYGEQEGLLYLVLQYVEQGVTLTDKMGVSMTPVSALRLTGRLLAALEYAHVRGIIHRDIKPANVLMPAPDWPMLADFGIAKILNDNSQQLTMPGLVVGTAAYIAPEQATGRPVTARTDIYATGVLLYEMLTGQVPFDADTPMAVLTQHIYEPPPPPSRLNPAVTPAVEAAVMRALEKNPDDRYQSAAEMADAMERVANQLQQTDTRVTGLYQVGVQAFTDGQWEQAVEHLSKLVALDPAYEDGADLLSAAQEARQRARTEARQQIEQMRIRRNTMQQNVAASRISEPAQPAAPANPATGDTSRFQAEPSRPATPAPTARPTSRLDISDLEPNLVSVVASSAANLPATGGTTPAMACPAAPAAGPTTSAPAGRGRLLLAAGGLIAIVLVVLGVWAAGGFGRSTSAGQPTSAPAAATAGVSVVATLPATAAPADQPTVTPPPAAVAIPAPTGQLIFEDEFRDRGQASGLEDLVNDTLFQRGYHPDKGEVYHLKLIRGSDTRSVFLPRRLYSNFNMQIELWDFSDEFSGTVAQGVIFRVRDPNHYYALMLDPRAGRYTVRKLNGPGNWSDIVAWKESLAIKRNKDHNVVRVDAAGNAFTIYLNDSQLDAFQDDSYTSGMLGMIVNNQDANQPHMHFDNLKVWSDDPPPPAVTQPPTRTTPAGEMQIIPGGEFIIGANEDADSQPNVVNVPDFYIDRAEVSNETYAKCVEAGKCTPQQELKSETHPSYANQAEFKTFPVIYVSWLQARDFCGWAGKRLPTEAEWEKAASWNHEAQQKTAWPWGNLFDTKLANSSESNLRDTTAIGAYPAAANGLENMAGNVSEWTSSIYKPYPYDASDGREDLNAPDDRVYRGGSWGQSQGKVRSVFRQSSPPNRGDREIGFRCVVAP